MIRVVTLPRRKAQQQPLATVYETVTAEERATADTLLRKAQALHRLVNASFVTAAAMAQAPELIKAARAAIDELAELIG